MRKGTASFFALFAILTQTVQSGAVYAEASEEPQTALESPSLPSLPEPEPSRPFNSFAGKVVKNKVRVRLQPNYAPILRELNRGDLVAVVGETEDFYAVQPPAGTKAYVFRTFVLDNIVEGNRVNVRLEPEMDAPVIAQLNSGDRIEGTVSPLNSKWLEISPPAAAHFYVAKEFVEKIGDLSALALMEKRRDEAERLMNSTYLISQTERQKPFNQINLQGITNNLNKIIKDYAEFSDQVSRATALLNTIQEEYMQKKIAYLEAKSQSSDALQAKNSKLSEEIQAQQERLAQLEKKVQSGTQTSSGLLSLYAFQSTPNKKQDLSDKMAAWLPAEKSLYEQWKEQNGAQPIAKFYEQQAKNAVELQGIIEPYDRAVKNKPGDFVLVNKSEPSPYRLSI